MSAGADALRHTIERTAGAWDQHTALRTSFIARFPTWDPNTDARIAVFAKCANVLEAALLSAVYTQRYLLSPEWWEKAFPRMRFEASDRQNAVDSYGSMMKLSLVHLGFAAIESSFRLYLRALDAAACLGATAEFESIYVCLLKRLGLREWENLLRLWRLLRNTVHNNGIYLPPSGKDAEVTFRGVTYVFRSGTPAKTDWDLSVMLFESAQEMLEAVVNSAELSAIAGIADTSAIAWYRR